MSRIQTAFIVFLIALASLALLLGCTEQIPSMPFTTSQLIAKATDLNYTLFQSGYYDGNCLTLDKNKITAIDCNTFRPATVNWSSLTGFPVGCSAGQAVRIVGASLTCISVGGSYSDANTLTVINGLDLNDSLSYVKDFNINRTIFVDGVFGSDATGQIGKVGKPFQTLETASSVAMSGDLIVVRPATYNLVASIGGDSVNWWFDEGAIINQTSDRIFSIVGTMNFNVGGHGKFYLNSTDAQLLLGDTFYGTIEADILENTSLTGCLTDIDGGKIILKANHIKADCINAVDGTFGDNILIESSDVNVPNLSGAKVQIGGLGSSSGFLKKDSLDRISIDSNSYLTSADVNLTGEDLNKVMSRGATTNYDLNISKATPTIILNSSDDNSNTATLSRSATNRAFTLKNFVGTPANNPIGLAFASNGNNPLSTPEANYFTTSGTINFWYKRNSITGSQYFFIHQQVTPSTFIVIRASNNGDGAISFAGYSGGTYQWQIAVTNTDTTSWHMLTATWTTNSAHLYIDNAEVGIPDTANSVDFTGYSNALRFGDNGIGQWPFRGNLDEIGVWNKVLSLGERTTLYASGTGVYGNIASSPFDSNLVAGYHLEENTGTSTADFSGNSRTGALSTGASWGSGYVPAPTSAQEATIINSQNGVSAGERGINTFGDGAGQQNINFGTTANIQYQGTTKVIATSTSIGNIDNYKYFFGTSNNSSIYFNGTNFFINPREVGTGDVNILSGNLRVDQNLYVKNRLGINTTTPTNTFTAVGDGNVTANFYANFIKSNTDVNALAGYFWGGYLRPRAGTNIAGTAPIKMTSGNLLTNTEAGAIEFNNDDFYATITTGAGGNPSYYPSSQTIAFVNATTYVSAQYYPWFSTDPTKSLTGSWTNNEWVANATTNQVFQIKLDSPKSINRIYYENAHTTGTNTANGAKNFTLWGSNDANFSAVVYANDTNWIEITGLSQTTFDQHTASDVPDAKYITFSMTPAYQYYRIKIADNWGGTNYVGLRRIELQDTTQPNGRGKVVITNNESGLTTGRIPYTTTNGRLTDSSNLTFDGTKLTTQDLNVARDLNVGRNQIFNGVGQGLPSADINSYHRFQEIVIGATDTWYSIDRNIFVDNNILFHMQDDNSLVAEVKGRYLINWSISAKDTANNELMGTIGVNNSPYLPAAAHGTVGPTGAYTNIGGSAIINLNVGDKVNWFMENESAASNITVGHITTTIFMLGGG